MALDLERHPHQPGGGGREQQWPDRTVDRAIRHVEETIRVGPRRGPSVQRVVDRAAGNASESSARMLIGCSFQVGLAQLGDAVRRAPAGGGLTGLEQRADLGVREIGDVVVDDRVALLGRSASSAARKSASWVGIVSVVAVSGRSPVGRGARDALRRWSIAL